MEIEKFEALLVEAANVRKGMIEFLYENRLAFQFERVDSHYVVYSLGNWLVRVWTANDDSSCRFYETLGGIELDHNDCYTDEMRKNLWKMTREAICQNGERRRIEQTQMRNDLYFKFKGVHQDVKFTGYDDANWWNNHRPVEVNEDDSITWIINWEKMEAVYKPKD